MPYEMPCLYFSNRFYLALMVYLIKGVKGNQIKRVQPLICMQYFHGILSKKFLSEVRQQICCNFYRFKDMRRRTWTNGYSGICTVYIQISIDIHVM